VHCPSNPLFCHRTEEDKINLLAPAHVHMYTHRALYIGPRPQIYSPTHRCLSRWVTVETVLGLISKARRYLGMPAVVITALMFIT